MIKIINTLILAQLFFTHTYIIHMYTHTNIRMHACTHTHTHKHKKGYVKFDEFGTRVQEEVYLQQYRREVTGLTRAAFARILIHSNNSFSYMNKESDTSIWPGLNQSLYIILLV